MEQALTYLLDNAIKYSPAKQSIEICSQSIDEDCCITVRDYGRGINEKEIFNLFQSYVLTNSMKFSKGKQVSLVIALLVLRMHHGTIVAENCEDGGSLFTLRWPVVQESPVLAD